MPTAANTSSFPVRALQQTTTSLEAAVFECLHSPRKNAVHKVRTSTRRIEAQLTLFPLVGGFPALGDEAKKIGRILKKLRSAAGQVRDTDVQRDLVAFEAKKTPDDTDIVAEAKDLRRYLRRCRDRQAVELVGLLKGLHAKLPKRIKAVQDVLAEAEQNAVPETRLLALVREWYNRQVEPHWQHAESGDPDELHTIRKIAKVARYLAETAPESATRARRLAAHFEDVQKAGGDWHDWLLLAAVARDRLGRKAALGTRFSTCADLALADFRHKLGYRM